MASRNSLTGARLPELDPALEFTAVTIPNPHLVALVDKYVSQTWSRWGSGWRPGRTCSRPGRPVRAAPAGARRGLHQDVRARGRLAASCGSGMAASRAVYSRITPVDRGRRVTVRNAGGMAAVSLTVRQGRWHPVLEGNATFVYRAEVDPADPDLPGPPLSPAPPRCRLCRPGGAERGPAARRASAAVLS